MSAFQTAMQLTETAFIGYAAEPMTSPESGRSDKERALQVLLQEYTSLKTEQGARIGFRDNLLYTTIGAVGAIASVALGGFSNGGGPVRHAFLLVPWVTVILGWTYLANDEKITRIRKYIRKSLAPRIEKLIGAETKKFAFAWENFHLGDEQRDKRKGVQLAIDLWAFVISGFGAVAAFFVKALRSPPRDKPALFRRDRLRGRFDHFGGPGAPIHFVFKSVANTIRKRRRKPERENLRHTQRCASLPDHAGHAILPCPFGPGVCGIRLWIKKPDGAAPATSANASNVAAETGKKFFAAPDKFELPALAVGQWIRMLMKAPGQPPAQTFVRIVGKEGDAFWYEKLNINTPTGTTIIRNFLTNDASRGNFSKDAIKKMKMRMGTGAAQEFSGPTLADALTVMDNYIWLIGKPNLDKAERADATVNAGEFKGCYVHEIDQKFLGESMKVKSWNHPAVPINGFVRSETTYSNGNKMISELYEMHMDGAKSALQ